MDLSKSGKLICELRKSKKMTQKQVADILGIEAKTVSKWETGRGFPDVSYISELADIFGVSEKILLSGNLIQNTEEVGNMKKIKFYVCPHCGSIIQGTGEYEVICCGSKLDTLKPQQPDDSHTLKISEIENDFYAEFNHEMTKEHFISFIAYAAFDRALTIKLYPEQDSSVRLAKMHGGKFLYYCNKHGLFEYKPKCERKKRPEKANTNLTALMSAFARAYHFENSACPVFGDNAARKLFSDDEYGKIEKYISAGSGDVKTYVNTYLAPTPLARARFCEDTLNTAMKTGTAQYVILGSGLDTFSLRCGKNNIDIFEIDKGDVIADKKMRINRAGIEIPDNVHMICADLSSISPSADLPRLLKEKGFDKNKKTLFSCLGLLYYLTKEEISNLFKALSEFAADGSTAVFDFADNHLFSSDVPRAKEMVNLAAESGEPMKSCFGYNELEMLLQKYSFLIYEFLSDKDIQSRYFSENGEMSAFEHINYVAAVLK